MKKYIKFLVTTFFSFIICFNIVSAEKINHIYNEEKDIASPFLIQYDTELKKYKLGLPIYHKYEIKKDKEYVYVNDNYILAYELETYEAGTNFTGAEKYHLYLNEKPIKEITEGQSLKIYYCISNYGGGGPNATGTAHVYLFTDSLQRTSKEKSLPDKINYCKDFESDAAKNGESESVASCKTFEKYFTKIEENFKNYSDIQNKNNANKNINILKTLCNSITKFADYNDNCMIDCLNLLDKLNESKKKHGIQTDFTESKCGFSGKLIQFIANIVKWIKYIIPILVIVLGILDFIKAISSEKDDEMKKAQGHFIKRLIAAALIFIIPFIIEFVLNKMGFDANGCGIIDL